jgi:arylsulfatase A-like enzyme
VLGALQAGTQEEIRARARMMAPVDEGVGQILELLERRGELDDTVIVFLGDNGFFGEHGLLPERRFAYEEGIRSPFVVRWPRAKAGSRVHPLVICQDIAPTFIELAGGRPPGRRCRAARCCRCWPPPGAGAWRAGAAPSSSSTGPSRPCPGSWA